MLEQAGYLDEATLYYREAVAGYRRWAHRTKVVELEQAHPEVRAKDLTSGDDARRTIGGGPISATVAATFSGGGSSVNDQMDLVTVLKVSQDISTQLTGSGVVRAVLTGIAQNAGAERVVFVRRATSGIETVYGELHGATYADIDVAEDRYTALPRSVVRVVRRTGRPLVIADARTDPAYATDPFVVDHRCRSIAAIPIRRNAEVMGFVVLENRLVAGAFTPQLVSLTQALVAQAAISLDNAILYDDLSALNRELEARVEDRTRALREVQQQLIESARKAGMADVAVEVLHSVGNALNSVNVSAQMIQSQLAGSKTRTLTRVTTLLDDHKDNLVELLTRDPRGGTIVRLLAMLGTTLTGEQDAMAGELRRLRTNIDSIVAVVQELNSTAEDKGRAILEAPHVLVGEVAAAVVERGAIDRVAIAADCRELPGAKVDKHKGLDILAGLLANALDAVASATVEPKQIRVSVREIPDAVVFQVSDNGVGIPSENLTRIFRGGFSSKSGRRGANLHRFANAATLAGGSLTAESEGPGRGATFTLVLPNRAEHAGTG
jgi:signal transduction histidine kinase